MAFAAVLFICLFLTFPMSSLYSDEGTHLLLSVFYSDLFSHVIETGSASPSAIYDYSMNYLVHYPKLQIAYPPLYHFTVAFLFKMFGPSEVAGRTVNLVSMILSAGVFYALAKKHFGGKTALIGSALFALSPYALHFSTKALQDYTLILWFLASIYCFDRAQKERRYFLAAGITAALAFLGKQMGGFLLPLYAVFLLVKKGKPEDKIKDFALILVPFLAITLPYLLVLNSVGGLEINKMVAIGTAQDQGEPTSPFDPYFWTYYLITPSLFAPAAPLLIAALAYAVYRKEPKSRELALMFALFYLAMSLIPNKEARFSQLFMLPAYLAGGLLLSRTKLRMMLPLLAVYVLISVLMVMPLIEYYPVKESAAQMSAALPDGANVALLSDDDPAYSSVFMWYGAAADRKLDHMYYRPCAFEGLEGANLSAALKEKGIYYVVYSNWSAGRQALSIAGNLEPAFKEAKGTKETSIFKFKDFARADQPCNSVCLTGKDVCLR